MNMIIGLIIIGVVIIIIAIVLIFIGRRAPNTFNEQLMESRLEQHIESGEELTIEKIEMSQPITERLIYPIARKFGELAMRFTPQVALENTREKIEQSGMGAKLDPTLLLAAKFFLALLFGGVVLFAFSVGSMDLPFWQIILFSIGMTVLGYYFPTLWIQSKINTRQKSVRHALPDALDLLTICVEAGLGFEAAMSKVSEKWENDLSLGFARVLQEIQLGKVRREALRDLADRIGIPDLTSFVAAVIQSEQLGVSLAKVLRIQADQMRVKRRQYAEQEAHKAPLKMLIPMTLLIFPSLIIVLVTPAGLQLMNSALSGMF